MSGNFPLVFIFIVAPVVSSITPGFFKWLQPTSAFVTGPNRKRHISCSSSSNSDEEEKKQKKKSKMRTQHSSRMKPRKLFKSGMSS